MRTVPAGTIVLSPQMASDFEDELDAVADSIRAATTDFDVQIRDPTIAPPGAFGPELSEVLTVILPTAADHVLAAVIDSIMSKLRGAWRRRTANQPAKRIARIYGPKGEVLATVEVPDTDADAAED